jgi:hypothetical protein
MADRRNTLFCIKKKGIQICSIELYYTFLKFAFLQVSTAMSLLFADIVRKHLQYATLATIPLT